MLGIHRLWMVLLRLLLYEVFVVAHNDARKVISPLNYIFGVSSVCRHHSYAIYTEFTYKLMS